MLLPPHEHTIDNDNDGNGGKLIDEHMSRWGSTTTTTETGRNIVLVDTFPPVSVVVIVDRMFARGERINEHKKHGGNVSTSTCHNGD